MSVSATAQLLSNTLYHKRFFPFYTFNLCAGLDDEGARRAWAAFLGCACKELCIISGTGCCRTSLLSCEDRWPVLRHRLMAATCSVHDACDLYAHMLRGLTDVP